MSSPSIMTWKVGAKAPPARPRTLAAGPLKLEYEAGFLRYLRCGNAEVLRMINFALRDENWGTVPFSVEKETVAQRPDSFHISYRAAFHGNPTPFIFDCTIEGRADGSIRFQINGQALQRIRTNRAGFTVLHPLAECVGQPLTIVHPDKTEERIHFPERINPHQPAFEIQGMRWNLPNGAEAELEFQGDVFEMEDQRNWTDASFKTYCTPLSRPFPVEMSPGDSVHQTIVLTLAAEAGAPEPSSQNGVTLEPLGEPTAFPRLHVGASQQTGLLTAEECSRLQQLGLSAYRVDLRLDRADWTEAWETQSRNAKNLGLPVELVLHFPSEPIEVPSILARIAQPKVRLFSITLFRSGDKTTPASLVRNLVPDLRERFPKARIGIGTDAFFAELNRERPTANDADFVVYSVNPQVHASDLRSIAETLEAQPATVQTARRFVDGKPIHISPLSLKMRWNPNATATPSPPEEGLLPEDADPRQASFFCAAWTLGSIKQLVQSGAAAITLYEAVGEKGLMHLEAPTYPDRFPAPPGSLYPVYFLLQELNGAQFLQPLASSEPLTVAALWIQHPKRKLLLANLSGGDANVSIPSAFRKAQLKRLEAETFDPLSPQGPESADFNGASLLVPAYSILVLEAV